MNASTDSAFEAPILDGEHHLLWAVLEDAIRTYLASSDCSTPTRRRAFAEVRSWFRAPKTVAPDLFCFRNICELLGIESDRLLNGLEAMRAKNELCTRRGVPRGNAVRALAA